MRFATLDEWLSWQEQLHPSRIDLGLDRVRAVLARLDLENPPFRILTIGGTNGKGSVAHTTAAILRAGGSSVGLFTSPHLVRYNERIRIDAAEADDAAICSAFAAVDRARDDISLTYFEFGTLAALVCFRESGVDTAVLEVGLGGRLDSVNAVDPDVAAVVSVGMDHTDWLGDSLDAIAREKAGIFRAGKPAVFGRGPAPAGLVESARETGAELHIGGDTYCWGRDDSHWHWQGFGREFRNLPLTRMVGAHQLDNAAVAIAAIVLLRASITGEAVAAGLRDVQVPGRLEALATDPYRYPEILLDVGHNPAAAAAIAAALAADPKPTRAVLGMLEDKDPAAFTAALGDEVQEWHLAGLAGYRGQAAEALADRLPAGLPVAGKYADVEAAVHAALEQSGPGERILVCGSFHTVGEFLASGLYSALVMASD